MPGGLSQTGIPRLLHLAALHCLNKSKAWACSLLRQKLRMLSCFEKRGVAEGQLSSASKHNGTAPASLHNFTHAPLNLFAGREWPHGLVARGFEDLVRPDLGVVSYGVDACYWCLVGDGVACVEKMSGEGVDLLHFFWVTPKRRAAIQRYSWI